LRDEIAAMFKQGLRVPAETEVGNLYSQRRNDNSFRPADVVRHGNGGDQQAAAMDITIGDPTCDSYIALESHKIKLKTAAEKHKHKMDLHRRRVDDLGDVPYVFQPLAFETMYNHRSNGGRDAEVVGQHSERGQRAQEGQG